MASNPAPQRATAKKGETLKVGTKASDVRTSNIIAAKGACARLELFSPPARSVPPPFPHREHGAGRNELTTPFCHSAIAQRLPTRCAPRWGRAGWIR